MPANTECSADMYRNLFQVSGTFDEGFYSPDYDRHL